MKRRARVACAVVGLAAAAAFAGDSHDGQLPKNAAEALEWSQPAIEAARKAKSAESPDIAKSIRKAVDYMQPFARKAADDAAFSGAWNTALTLSRFHGNKPTGDYAMSVKTAAQYLTVGMPNGRLWSEETGEPREGHLQQRDGLQRKRSDGGVAVSISICIYSFNTVYSGIGGENATGLAKFFLDYDKANLAKVESSSSSVTARAMSKGFPRAQFFEIVGTSKAAGRVRLRSYFSKGPTRTYAFDVAQFLDAKAEDSPFVAWQNGVEDPELESVLATFEEAAEKKK